MQTVLLVEDDENLGILLEEALEDEGLSVIRYKDGNAVEAALPELKIDLAILDVMLPGSDGFTIGKKLKERSPQLPILFLTAKSQVEARLQGLTIGDDYMVKPFHTEELLLRIKNLLSRNSSDNSSGLHKIGNYRFDADNYQLFGPDGRARRLTERETKLLNLLCHHKGRVAKRETLLTEVWGKDDYFTGRSMDVFISRLRKYLNEDDAIRIQVVHGVGFMLTEEEGR
jgi:DNA-binding response OmpR family regulator